MLRGLGEKAMKTLLVLALAAAGLFPAWLWATPAKPALEVVVLGSGGPRPFGRGGSSYILLVDGTPRILLDAGPGAFLRIGELRRNAPGPASSKIRRVPSTRRM